VYVNRGPRPTVLYSYILLHRHHQTTALIRPTQYTLYQYLVLYRTSVIRVPWWRHWVTRRRWRPGLPSTWMKTSGLWVRLGEKSRTQSLPTMLCSLFPDFLFYHDARQVFILELWWRFQVWFGAEARKCSKLGYLLLQTPPIAFPMNANSKYLLWSLFMPYSARKTHTKVVVLMRRLSGNGHSCMLYIGGIYRTKQSVLCVLFFSGKHHRKVQSSPVLQLSEMFCNRSYLKAIMKWKTPRRNKLHGQGSCLTSMTKCYSWLQIWKYYWDNGEVAIFKLEWSIVQFL